jgi:hypothetical protein
VKQAFEALVIEEDPCVLTGFEVGEALRVLQGRAALLKLKNWGCFGRRAGDKVTVKVPPLLLAIRVFRL